MSPRRVLPPAPDGDRFRIVRMWRVNGRIKAEIIHGVDQPSHAIMAAFGEPMRTIAVDRRGDIYADNHKPIQERV